MQYTRESAIERLLKNYGPYYNIHMIEDDQTPITARCDFFEHSGQYVISKKAEKMPYLQKFSFFIAWLDEFSCSAGACGRLPY